MEVAALVVAFVTLAVQVIQTWNGWKRDPPRKGRHQK